MFSRIQDIQSCVWTLHIGALPINSSLLSPMVSSQVADFECSCSAGYRGRFCDEEINECDSDPCGNGGSCTDEEAKFSCSCAKGMSL